MRRDSGFGATVPRDLLLINEMAAAVLRPARFVGFSAERFLFAVADRLDAAGIHARLYQCVLDGIGAVVAQSQVVLGGPALVAMSLNGEVHVGKIGRAHV